MESPAKPHRPAPASPSTRPHRLMDTCSLWSLALIGVIALIPGVGLCTVASSDWTFPQRLAIVVVYWVTLGCITTLACSQVSSPSLSRP